MEVDIMSETKIILRLEFERALYDVFCKVYHNPKSTLWLLRESPTLLAEFIKRYENDLENIFCGKSKVDNR